MIKIGDRVILITNNPDDQENLHVGSKGTIIAITFDRYLVRWDDELEGATGNNRLISDYFPVFDNTEDEYRRNYNELYGYHCNHLWYVDKQDIKKILTNNFRKKRKEESELEYKIATKINELDLKWKEKQNAKTSTLSL